MYFFYTNQTVPNNSGDGNTISGAAYAGLGSGGAYIIAPEVQMPDFGCRARFRNRTQG